MIEQSLGDWQKEMLSRFPLKNDAAFICPACRRVSAVKDIIAAGGDADDAPQQCIGRLNGKGTPNGQDEGFGCNWASYGLLGTLGKGRKVVFPDGHKAEVFDFAPEVPADANA